ncbi:MAG: hypothetical protein KDI79_15875 [Anaerolineae bacterium]|nr:hypothetical protein [Anaerolineae bacterium]
MVQTEKAKVEMQQAFEQMWEELHQWRAEHPQASFDEIAAQVTPRRRELMGKLLIQLASQHGDGTEVEGVPCPDCGQAMSYKGKSSRDVTHLEGELALERAYYYCATCEGGIFPPG